MAGPLPLIQLDAPGPRWVKILDQDRCIGCHACTTACKSENEVPLGVTRTYVKAVEVGTFPQVRRDFQVTRCNQCSDAPCVAACPTSAMFTRPDGIVDFNKDSCIGCKACIAACPYDAIFINPEDHSAEKCNFCAQRIDVGLEPACVVVCPAQAILVGDLNDPTSKVAQIINREAVQVRRPEKETRPGVFYKGAHQATLDPLAARSPEGPVYMWSEKESGPMIVESGHPNHANSSAAALLAYDVTHRAPWDWRVSLYTWTKGIAAGAYLVPLLLLITGVSGAGGPLWQWMSPILAGGFLGLTGLILLADLEHPGRFIYIFTRPQWRSWLVRGAVIISAYGLVLGLHFAVTVVTAFVGGGAQVAGLQSMQSILAIAGLPLATMTAVYTAYLFAQAKARDLWQNPLLAPHLAVQAMLAGSAILIPVAMVLEPSAAPALGLLLAATSGIHLLLVAGEITLPHPTAHAHLASWHLTRGRFRQWFWLGVVLVGAGLMAPVVPAAAPLVAAAALAGLLAHEHAYVQAGQSVPLA